MLGLMMSRAALLFAFVALGHRADCLRAPAIPSSQRGRASAPHCALAPTTGRQTVFASVKELGRALDGTGKAKLVWAALRAGRDPWTDESVTPKARALLAHQFDPLPTEAARTVASDGTVKLLVSLRDGLQIESVVIPFAGRPTAPKPVEPRTTVCVSSQVGCSRGCVFCATGKMGLIRNLSAEEIVAQVALAQRVIAERGMPKLHNVVFMGMGEPLNNPAAVRRAVLLLTDQECFQLARTRVSVSTVGPSPAAIVAAAGLPGMLAWSVHAADDAKRRQLVPTTTHCAQFGPRCACVLLSF